MSSTLSADDRLEIAELTVRYGQHFDAGEGAAWAALFGRDGALVGSDGRAVSGRALAEMPPASGYAARGMRHLPGPLVLESDGDAVRGRSYGQVVRMSQDGQLRTVLAGEYHDVFVRREAWHFSERRFVAWTAPASSEAV